ncbi:MAG: hypothetical protein KJ749_13810, partial [Planctomycetes bacterium]|nr:hypothetical protein [Planctomycetota bacterium]
MMQYQRIRVISGKGSGTHQFAHVLNAIDVTRAGLIYAAGDTAVKAFDVEGHLGVQWPTEMPGFCVAVSEGGDGDPTVYVGQAGQLQLLDLNGKSVSTWRDPDRLG